MLLIQVLVLYWFLYKYNVTREKNLKNTIKIMLHCEVKKTKNEDSLEGRSC